MKLWYNFLIVVLLWVGLVCAFSSKVQAECPKLIPGDGWTCDPDSDGDCTSEYYWDYDKYTYEECSWITPSYCRDYPDSFSCRTNNCGIGRYTCGGWDGKALPIPCCDVGPVDGSCGNTAPSCGGTCPVGESCRARYSNPGECTCSPPAADGCYGGWVWVGPDDSIRRCCVTSAPTAPTLLSPADGSIFNQPEVTLNYRPTDDWKGGCPNNSYFTNIFLAGALADGSPAGWNQLDRIEEAMGTAAVVGANIEITGVNMPAVGTQMRVKLTYQSNPVYVDRPRAPLRRGWAVYPWAALK